MPTRMLTLILVTLILGTSSTAEAQRRRRLPTGLSTNPVHERIKTQADQAYQEGRYAEVVELTSQVLQQNSSDHVAYYLRGSARVELGRAQSNPQLVRDGIADAREAIRISDNDNPDYYLPYLYGMTNLARIEQRAEHAEAAVTVADQMLQQRQNLQPQQRANILYQRGLAQVARGDFAKALNDFDAALRAVPAHFGALIARAEAAGQAKRHDEAIQSFDAAIRAFPAIALPYHNKAVYLQQQGDAEGAIAAFGRAITVDPNYFYSYTSRGIAQLDAGNAKQAEHDLTTSLRLNPEQALAYSARGDARIDLGNLEAAVSDHRNAAEREPRNPALHAKLGFASFFNGDLLEAVDAFEQALKLDPKSQELTPWRAWSLILLDQEDRVRTEYASAIQTPQENRTWPQHLIAYQLGSETADELLSAAATQGQPLADAQRCEAWFFIGSKQARDGATDEAVASFQKAVESQTRQLAAYRGAKLILEELGTRPAVESGDANP